MSENQKTEGKMSDTGRMNKRASKLFLQYRIYLPTFKAQLRNTSYLKYQLRTCHENAIKFILSASSISSNAKLIFHIVPGLLMYALVSFCTPDSTVPPSSANLAANESQLVILLSFLSNGTFFSFLLGLGG